MADVPPISDPAASGQDDPTTAGLKAGIAAERAKRQAAEQAAAAAKAEAEQYKAGHEQWTAHTEAQHRALVDANTAKLQAMDEGKRAVVLGLGLEPAALAKVLDTFSAPPAPAAAPAAPAPQPAAAPNAPAAYPAGGVAPGGGTVTTLTDAEQAFKASRTILTNATDEQVKRAFTAAHPTKR